MEQYMKDMFLKAPKDKRNETIALAFLLELELTRGSKTEEDNVKTFIDYANFVNEGESE